MHFFLIIPVLEPSADLDRSIGHVLMQAGSFDLDLHVQCSRGSGLESIVEFWREWLSRQNSRNTVNLTFSIEKDGGLYDAIAKATEHAQPDDQTVMTWLGVGDCLLPGALTTVANIMTAHPEIEWITGHSNVSGPDGANCYPHPHSKYRRANLANGKHDGRSEPFVMQEGTFWRFSLWKKAGGINSNFKLAGDWNLWRRFGALARLYQLEFPLGKFSQQDGQLSSDRDRYYAEVDDVMKDTKEISCEDHSAYLVNRYIGTSEWAITREDPPREVKAARKRGPLQWLLRAVKP